MVTQWIQSCPYHTKSAQETQKSLGTFLRPEEENKLKFARKLSWNHEIRTPQRSETNGIAGRAVRRVQERTSSEEVQSGLQGSWWADATECYYYLRNVQELLASGQTLYDRRFNSHLKGQSFSSEQK